MARSMTTPAAGAAAVWVPVGATRAAAASRAAWVGGRRTLPRCGGADVAAAIAARARAMTWPWSRTMAPAPVVANRWRAITMPPRAPRPGPGVVAMSIVVDPRAVSYTHLRAHET